MHGNSMNVSVQNNLKLLRKRDKFKYSLGGYNNSCKTEYNLPNASSKQLRDIRKRLQNERKIWWVKTIGLTVLVFTALIGLFIYLIKNVI